MEFNLEYPLSSTISKDLNFDTSTFHIESQHMPLSTYISTKNATPNFAIPFRQETISHILNLSQNLDPFLSYIAINYVDRFLSNRPIQEGKPWILRLVALSCVSLASKMRKTELSVTDLQTDGGLIIDKQTVGRMEWLILGALKWRMRSVTPFAFINFFISLFKFKDTPLRQVLKARAIEIIFKSQHEWKILEFKSSIVAASALLSASHELFPLQFPCFKKAISTCSYVNKDSFFKCNNVMQEIALEGYESVLDRISSSNTPINVLDGQWSNSSSDSEKSNTATDGTIRSRIRDIKRRKISSCSRTNDMFSY